MLQSFTQYRNITFKGSIMQQLDEIEDRNDDQDQHDPEEPVELTEEFEILPKTVELSWSDDFIDYTGQPQAPTATIENSYGKDEVAVGEYEYKKDEEGSEYSKDKPIDEGSVKEHHP